MFVCQWQGNQGLIEFKRFGIIFEFTQACGQCKGGIFPDYFRLGGINQFAEAICRLGIVFLVESACAFQPKVSLALRRVRVLLQIMANGIDGLGVALVAIEDRDFDLLNRVGIDVGGVESQKELNLV